MINSIVDALVEEKKEGQLEPLVSVKIKEDRNNCYDNITANIDRGMPGNPLEKEIEKQEARELAEQEEDKENYECHLQGKESFNPNKSPLDQEVELADQEDDQDDSDYYHQEVAPLDLSELPYEPKVLVSIKEDRNNCYDNIAANIDRSMPGNPLEKEIEKQERCELAEQEEDNKHYRSLQYPESAIEKHNENNFASEVLRHEFGNRSLGRRNLSDQEDYNKYYLQSNLLFNPNEGPLEPTISIPIKEDRNNCYDNISANIDRGMPGHPLEKEIEEQERREAREQEEAKEDYELELLDKDPFKFSKGPLNPTVSVPIKEDRNYCYDNISANIDRGMPGHPLEKEMEEQERREAREQEEDKEDYELELLDKDPFKMSKGPLNPTISVPVKEDRNYCYDNITANIDRGMPGHPLERDFSSQERREAREQEEDREDYEFDLHGESPFKFSKGPLNPTISVPVKEDRNNCYDNIAANIDRGMPGHPLERDFSSQERRECNEQEEDSRRYRALHYPESAIEKHNENNYASEVLRNEFGTRPEEGVLMQLEINEEEDFSFSSDSDDLKKIHPPSSPNNSPRRPFISNYDPSIFYESPPDLSRSMRPKIVRNKIKNPVKLNVTLKEIGLDGLDSTIPGKTAQIRHQERLIREKMKKKKTKPKIWSPNQTNFSKSQNRVQVKLQLNQERPKTPQNQDLPNISQKFDYSSDESYEVHNFEVEEIDNESPPPSPQKEIAADKNDDKPFTLNIKRNHRPKISEPKKKEAEDVKKSPRRKKEAPKTSTYDPSIFYAPFPSSQESVPGKRVKYVNDLITDPIKLTVTLKDIGLEGLDSAIPEITKSRRKEKLRK